MKLILNRNTNKPALVMVLLFLYTFSWANQVTDIKALLSKSNQFQGSNTATLGTDNNCDFIIGTDTINDIISTGVTRLNITSQVPMNESVDLTLSNSSIDISGGYDNCNDAEIGMVGNQLTIFSGVGLTSPIFTLENPNNEIFVGLSNLKISQANNNAIYVDNAQIELLLNKVVITQNGPTSIFNAGNMGAGLWINGHYNGVIEDRSVVVMRDTLITENTANTGGGVYCKNSQIYVFGQSGISKNSALSGGGIAVSEGCEMNFLSGTNDINEDTVIGLANNSAERFGGGAYVVGIPGDHYGRPSLNLFSHTVLLFDVLTLGNNQYPVNVSNNEARSTTFESSGGGIYIKGGEIQASGLQLLNNSANYGAGITLANINGHHFYPTDVEISRMQPECWDHKYCNKIANNQTDIFNGTGGAVEIIGNVDADMQNLTINQTWISNNRADKGLVLSLRGNGHATFSNNIIVNNGSNGNNFFADDGLFSFGFLTSSDTQIFSASHNTVSNNNNLGYVFDLRNITQSTITSSIFNTTSQLSRNTVNTIFDCVLSNTDEGVTSSNSQLFVSSDQAGFVDANNNDFSLDVNSIAIDQCDNALIDVGNLDYFNNDRNVDLSNHINNSGSYDMGAIEYIDVIFTDGFETL